MTKIKEAKEAFKKQYGHLHSRFIPGGINGIGAGGTKDKLGIAVMIESSEEVYKIIPNEFMGFPVYKYIVGKIVAQRG